MLVVYNLSYCWYIYKSIYIYELCVYFQIMQSCRDVRNIIKNVEAVSSQQKLVWLVPQEGVLHYHKYAWSDKEVSFLHI